MSLGVGLRHRVAVCLSVCSSAVCAGTTWLSYTSHLSKTGGGAYVVTCVRLNDDGGELLTTADKCEA